jgi:hypothetical protein
MARALLRPFNRGGQAAMSLATLNRGARREDCLREERMRERNHTTLAVRHLLTLGRLQVASNRTAEPNANGFLARLL